MPILFAKVDGPSLLSFNFLCIHTLRIDITMVSIHHHLWGCKELKHPAIKGCMKTLINLKVGVAIKKLRKERGLTQEQLAEMIKTSYKYMQRIEGKSPPDLRISSIQKIAKALRVKISQLIEQ